MTIDFPNSPATGTTYSYEGVTYTWQAAGYWKIVTPGTLGAASVAEVNAGTDSGKYITPDSLEGSDYARKTSPTFTGAPLVPTQSSSNSSTRIASTAFVHAVVKNADFAAGTEMLFFQASAPTGWTRVTTSDNSVIRLTSGSSLGGSVGGSSSFSSVFTNRGVGGTIGYRSSPGTINIGSTKLTYAQSGTNRLEKVRISSVNAQTDITVPENDWSTNSVKIDAHSTAGAYGLKFENEVFNATQSHSHTGSISGTSHNHTFSGTSINMSVKYRYAITCRRNAD